MKFITTFLFLITALPSFAITRAEVERLLQTKNISLSSLEAKGAQIIMGEVTGHGRAIPFNDVQAILTNREAILRHEIEGVSPIGLRSFSQIESLRVNGQYILKEDVKAIITR